MATKKILIVMSDYGHDPTETAVPWAGFKNAGFDVKFATEKGATPVCDKKMLEGTTGKLLGAKKSAIDQYKTMAASDEWTSPLSWTASSFILDPSNLVLFPGGHDKGVRQVIDSPDVHRLAASYFPQALRGSDKAVGAICHGVMVLSSAAAGTAAGAGESAGGQETGGDKKKKKSVIHECVTTTLPGMFESGIFWATRAFLGDYYKTYGAGSENVEDAVCKGLDDPKTQYKCSVGAAPFVVEDEKYNYISARFPGDAELFTDKMVELVKSMKG